MVKRQRIGRHLRVPKVLTLIRLRLVSDMVRRVRRRMLPQRLQIPRLRKKAKADKAAAAVKKTESTGTMPEDGQIYISEIMFAGGGILPQWIEISNGSRTEEINLSGWTLTVDNAAADADVSIGASATFTIADGTTIDASGQQDRPVNDPRCHRSRS